MITLKQAEEYQAELKRLKARYPEIYDSPIPSIPEIINDFKKADEQKPSLWADDYIY